jgi:hypothetical protein
MNQRLPETRAPDFDFLIGTWHVDHRRLIHRLAGSTDWETFAGTATCRKVLDGIGNVDEITMPSRGMTGMTVRLFNPATGLWSLHWASNLAGVLEPPVIGGFENGVGRFYGDDTHEGRPIRVRYIWDQISATGARWQQAFSVDHERTWETNWVMTFTRAAATSTP